VTRPVITISINAEGKAMIQSNMPFAQTKSLVSQVLNDMIQREAVEQIQAQRKIIVPTVQVALGGSGGR
jgi:hypothetical protein